MTKFSYSIPILYTIIFLCMIVSLVMIVVANEIARAFTLVGALSVIRFRTPIKDARDGAFIFYALATGMGAGVGLYLEATIGTVLIGIFILLLYMTKFGFTTTKEILVKFQIPLDDEDTPYHQETFETFFSRYNLINARSLHERGKMELTFFVRPRKETEMIEFSKTLSAIPQIDKVSVIVCEDDELPDNVF